MVERIHLEIIQALQREGSLTKAAGHLSLTQPALTHSIKKLESILGCKLWMKHGRRLRLTPYGEFLLKRAQKILPQFTELETTLEALVEGKRGKLNICAECHPCYELIIEQIGGFLKSWKDVDINISKSFTFNGIEAILNRSIDLIISPDRYSHPHLEYYPIVDFELLFALPKGDPLLEKEYLEPVDLKGKTILTYPVEISRLDVYTNFFIPHGMKPKKHLKVEATELILQLVSTGRGISYFPEWLIKKYKDVYNIESRKMGHSGIHKTLYVCIRREDREVEYIKDFIEKCTRI